MTIKLQMRAMWPVLAAYAAGLATAGILSMLLASPPPPSAEAGQWASSSPPWASPVVAASKPPAPTSSAVPQHSAPPLGAAVREQIVPLQARLQANPDDLAARKQLAVLLVQNQQLMPAYDHATRILAADPEDLDGLYVHGVVRLAMGHGLQALNLFDRVLAQVPNHALALQGRAEAQRKIGGGRGAQATAAKARNAAGRSSNVEDLLTAASDGTLGKMMRSSTTTQAAQPKDDSD